MNCEKWLRSICNTVKCIKWDRCTLMNDNALPPGTNAADYEKND